MNQILGKQKMSKKISREDNSRFVYSYLTKFASEEEKKTVWDVRQHGTHTRSHTNKNENKQVITGRICLFLVFGSVMLNKCRIFFLLRVHFVRLLT